MSEVLRKGGFGMLSASGMVSLHTRLNFLYPQLGLELVTMSDAFPRLMLGHSELPKEKVLILLKAKQIELQPLSDTVNSFITLLEK